MLELIGREHTYPVGSRFKTILGSTRKLDSFQKKLRKVQKEGLTRLEVSIL